MNWRRVTAIVPLLIAGLSCRRGAGDVPVYVVTRSHFVRRVTADGILRAKNAARVSAPEQPDGPMKLAWLATDGATVKKGDVLARFDPTDFEAELVAGKEDLAMQQNKRDETDVSAKTVRGNLQRDARQAQREFESARMFKMDADVFSRYQRVESQVDQDLAADKKQHAHNVLGVREEVSAADRALVDIEKKKADMKIQNAMQGLSALEVRSPSDGILVLERDWRGEMPRVGATVWNGDPIGEVPDTREMKANVFVLEADAAGVAVGQRASVTIDARPDVVYHGIVSRMDKLARPRFRGVPVQYFGVDIALDRTDPRVMKPGTRVHSILEADDIPNAFSIPRQALFEKNGKAIVYRRRGNTFEPSEVTIATSSAGRVVVTKGIAEGDQLALANVSDEE